MILYCHWFIDVTEDTDPKVEFLLQDQESLYVIIHLQDDEYYVRILEPLLEIMLRGMHILSFSARFPLLKSR